MSSGRVEFANALRGPAALAVLASHFLGTFWLDHAGTLASLKLAPITSAREAPSLSIWLFPNIPFNWGGFGVGLFFLISGFVIPFSLQRYTPRAFLAARAIRILPVYAVGFLIGIGSLAALFAGMGKPFPFSSWHVAVHAVAGLRAIIPFDRIDGIVWTIEMEVRFYIVCAIIAGALARGSLKAFIAPLFLFGACLVMAWVAAGEPSSILARGAWKMVTVAALNGPFLMFMFIGVAVNYHYRRHLSGLRLAAVIGGLSVLFVVEIRITPSSLTVASVGSYAVALLVFLLAYKYQGAWTTARFFRFFAAISYPLYAVHAMLGYTIIYCLVTAGVPALGAVAVACAASLGAGWTIHRLVEIPSQNLAQRVGRILSGTGTKAVLPDGPEHSPNGVGVLAPEGLARARAFQPKAT